MVGPPPKSTYMRRPSTWNRRVYTLAMGQFIAIPQPGGIPQPGVPTPGSLVGPIGTNRYGWQIFQFLDPKDRQWHHVVRLPDGRILYSDAAGDIGHGSGFGKAGAGAVLG